MNDREDKFIEIYGCDREAAKLLNKGDPFGKYGTFAGCYKTQRLNAKYRGVGWSITFPQWVQVWEESGKWEMRGRGKGQYCMSRRGDTGPYSPDNVFIGLSSDNCRDGVAIVNNKKIPNVRLGQGRGWYYSERNTNRPYSTSFRGIFLGSFPTAAEAEAAYQAAIKVHFALTPNNVETLETE